VTTDPTTDPDPALPTDPDVPETRGGSRERWDVLVVIGAGGSLGAAARWGVAQALTPTEGGFPLATFSVNVAGCLLLGVLMVLVADRWPPSRYRRPFLGVGVLGGFTTFSTFEVEARDLVAGGHGLVAAAYVLASLVAGLLAVALGVAVTRRAVR
jgi:CrcB protein